MQPRAAPRVSAAEEEQEFLALKCHTEKFRLDHASWRPDNSGLKRNRTYPTFLIQHGGKS